MKTVRTLLRQGARLVIIAPMVTLLYGPTEGRAALILCSDMASFTVRGASTVTNVVTSSLVGRLCFGLATFRVLGASTVTNVPPSNVVGNVGAQSNGGANAIADFRSKQGRAGPALTRSAQGKLTAAGGSSGSSGRGILLAAKPRGYTLVPVAILDDEDNYENKTDAKDLCDRGPANTGAGTLTQNILSGNCMGMLAVDNGLGELYVKTIPGGDPVTAFLHGPVTAVPEPGTLLLFGLGLMGLFAIRKSLLSAA